MMAEDAILVVTSPPKSFEFGIDCMSYETGEEFRGVSVIPNGLHFIYHSTGMGARQGFFITAKKNDIIITSWDPSNEEIAITPLLTEAAVENLKLGVRRGDLNKNLGPYPLAQHGNWINLSNMISEAVLSRADVAVGTLVFPGDVEDDTHLRSRDGVMKPYFPGLARIARFIALDEQETAFVQRVTLNPEVTAGEISRLHMDKSTFVALLVKDHYDGSYEELLGELQLSFILFMMIYSYPALEHWKRLVNILCQCEEIMMNKPAFYATFLRVLYEQLGYSPDDFFHTELSHNNFLRPAMTSLFQMLNAEGLPSTLLEHRRRLLTFMRKKFNLFDENAGEEYFNHDDIPLHRYKNASSMAPSVDELYNLVDEDRPVVVCFDDASEEVVMSEAASFHPGFSHAAPEIEISPHDIEKERFGWRYPVLYEFKEPTEDMTMAAARLIESCQSELENEAGDKDSALAKVYRTALLEARLFIENEVPLFSRIVA